MDRPFVCMNAAATADGKIDTFERHGASISSPRDKERVDKLRADADAVMIGGRTLHGEDPKLTVKSALLRAEREALGLPPNPAKVAVASQLEIKPDSNFLGAGAARIILFTTSRTSESQLALVRSRGAEVYILDADRAERVDVTAALGVLKKQGINRLLVEGGATLNFELLDLGLVDELTIFVAPMIFGGDSAPTLAGGFGLARNAAITLKLVRSEQSDDGGVLLHYQLSSNAAQD
jgi:2,5-diamino-6-(ribosylamino)-4(3H)-pyrimidinone 5'-phosphate reductase